MLDRKRLLKKVQRMNEAAEEDRLRNEAALQRRIRDVEVEIQSLTETIYRLRHARTSDEFIMAKDRREKLRARLEQLRRDADPLSEMDRVNQAIDEAKAKHADEVRVEQARLQAHLRATAARLENHPDGSVRHPAPWDIDVLSPAPIYRRSVGLGEAEPDRLKVEWSRFDFVPSVPWVPAYARPPPAKQQQQLSSSRSAAGAAASDGGGSVSSRRRDPHSSLSAAAASSFPPALAPLSPPTSPSSASQSQSPLALPPRLASTLTRSERALPAHPAYLLPSAVSHATPFVAVCKGRGGKEGFSRPPRDRPATDAETRRARALAMPDRTLYRPEQEGKDPWRKPPPPARGRAAARALFSRLQSDAEWLRARDAAADAERERRFYALCEDGRGGGGAGSGGGGAEDAGFDLSGGISAR